MTTGAKIKILRNNMNLTGKQLSELTGINHGLIRKYETTNCKPQYSHILTIATALNVRPYVITQNIDDLKLETVGDLYSIVIFLYNSKFLTLRKGTQSNNVNIELNPLVVQLFDLNFKSEEGKVILKGDLTVSINKTLENSKNYDLFLEWVEQKNILYNFINSLSDKNNLVAVKTICEIKQQIEILELKLQQNNVDKLCISN